MAFAEDLSVFFSSAEFAVEATFAPASGGAAVSALVILDTPTGDVLGGDALSEEYAITCPAAALPGVRRGDRGVVAGVAYRVREVRLVDDGGLKKLLLSRE